LNNFDTEEFYSLDFLVNTDVLTPRNETEILVNEVLKYLKNSNTQEYTYIDVGTGSGCIPISILKNIFSPFAKVFGVDISMEALEVFAYNIAHHSLEEKIHLERSNLLEIFWQKDKITSQKELLSTYIPTKNLLITANLPYIKNWDFENMDEEVLQNDPHIALFWWEETGFELYEELFFQIKFLKAKYSLQKIIVFIEIGFDQYEYSKAFFQEKRYVSQYYKDYSENWRVVRVDI